MPDSASHHANDALLIKHIVTSSAGVMHANRGLLWAVAA